MRGSTSLQLCAARTLYCTSTDALELVSSLRCCRYRAKRWDFAGTASRPLEPAQVFYLQKACRYSMTVLLARPLRMVASSLLAKICTSVSSSSSSSLQLPRQQNNYMLNYDYYNQQHLRVAHMSSLFNSISQFKLYL